MITLFIVTLGTMLIVVLDQSHTGNFSAKGFLYEYLIIWVCTMFTLAVVSVLWFTSYTENVYYAKTTSTDTYLKITSYHYTTKFMGENSLTFSTPNQVSIEKKSEGFYRYETGKWNF